VLRSAGYQVLDAANLTGANEGAGQYPHRIDLLLARTGLRLVFMPGYPERAVSRSGGDLEGAHFLPKPFKPPELRVREIEARTWRPPGP